jgi:hypothetical protein
MTTLEIILIAIVWIAYGVFNSWQHEWYKDTYEQAWFFISSNVILAPIALVMRIVRGVFYWRGGYE